jgi:DNA-binding FadR family transcriptional regulator
MGGGRKPNGIGRLGPISAVIPAGRLHEGVVRQIVRQIADGTLEPGTVLPAEPELAKRFGVSRTVVREAVHALSSQGLIAVRHGSGMRVQPPERWRYLDPLVLFEVIRSGQEDDLLDELLEVRRIFEVEGATLAAERRTNEGVATLRSILDRMAKTINDLDEYTRLDGMFHDQILIVARNRLLRESLKPVAEVLNVARTITIRQSGTAEGSMRGHEEIYAGIQSGDSEAAREAMRSHILQFELDMRAALKVGVSDLSSKLADGMQHPNEPPDRHPARRLPYGR